MPRTASKSPQRQSLHSRLRREKRERNPSETERTPVLLRLPEVELPAEEPLHSDEAYAIPSELESEPTYTELPKPNPQPTTADTPEPPNTDGVAEPESLHVESTDAAFDETVNTEPAVAVTNSAPDLETQTIVSTPQTPASASLKPEEEYALHSASESDATWWEHWSSGVVLILLIIALVTASIIAFNDTTETDPTLLAENPVVDASNNDALNELTVPGLESTTSPATPSKPTVELPAFESSESVATETPLTLGAADGTGSGEESISSPSLLVPASRGDELQFATDGSGDSEPNAEDSLLELPDAGMLSNQQVEAGSSDPLPALQLSPPAAEVASETTSLAPIQSGLQPPVTQPEQPLFPATQMAGKIELPLPDGNFETNTAPATPDLSNYVRANQQLQTPQGQPSSYQQLVEKQKQMEANGPYAVASSSGSPSISNASLVGQANSSSAANGPTQPGLVGTTSEEAKVSTGVAETATPDSDINALIEAYRHFERVSKPTTSNRYPDGQ